MKQKFVSLKFAIYIAINAEFIYENTLNLIYSQINKWQVKCKGAIRLSLLYLRTLIFALSPSLLSLLLITYNLITEYNWNYADAVNELSYLLEVAECSRMLLVCMCQCGGTIKLTIDWVI